MVELHVRLNFINAAHDKVDTHEIFQARCIKEMNMAAALESNERGKSTLL